MKPQAGILTGALMRARAPYVAVGRIVVAAIVLPVLLMVAASPSFAGWRCQYDAGLRASRCCPNEPVQSAPAADQQPSTIAASRCCHVEQVRTDRVPSDVSRPQSNLTPPDVWTLPEWASLEMGFPASASARPYFGPDRGLRGGKHVLLQKQTLLI